MVYLINYILLLLFLIGTTLESPASQKRLLDDSSQPNYGAFQNDRKKDQELAVFLDLTDFTLIEILPSEDQSSASPFERLIVLLPDISSLLTKMISPHDQFNLICASKYTYKMMYPLIEFEVINQKIRHILRGNIFFADKIPISLKQVTSLFQRAESLSGPDSQKFWDLCECHEGMIHTLIDAAQEAQDTPSVAVATKINDHLRTNITYLTNLSNYDNQNNKFGLYDRLKKTIFNLPRDRYCLLVGAVGFITVGSVIAISYSITTDQAQSQAFSNFMTITEIEIPFMKPPTCFEECLEGPWSESGYYINKNTCDRWLDQCPCPGGPNQSCYSIRYNRSVSEYINATLSEWVDYLADKCHFQNNGSGYWPQYIQELKNGTRHLNSDPYLCAPNPDGETITCGYSYPYCNGESGTCLYFYSGSAICATHEAWKAHLITYFAPTGILIGLAIIGVIINWYCF